MLPFADGTGRVIAGCPVCKSGTMLVQFLDRPPRCDSIRKRGDDVCSTGCSIDRIEEALA